MTEVDLSRRDSYTHWTPVHIRFADMDILRHVNNVAQAEYFEASRTAFVYDVIKLAGMDKTNEFVLARVVIDFLKELHYPGSVEVGARLTRLGNKSITSGYGIFQGETCFATSEAVNVFYDLTTRTTMTPAPAVRTILEKELERPTLISSEHQT
ncbi:MAG: thioesterase family protein [Pseudomonadota bacterium]